jgi:hypothetical protein
MPIFYAVFTKKISFRFLYYDKYYPIYAWSLVSPLLPFLTDPRIIQPIDHPTALTGMSKRYLRRQGEPTPRLRAGSGSPR